MLFLPVVSNSESEKFRNILLTNCFLFVSGIFTITQEQERISEEIQSLVSNYFRKF